MVIRNIGVGSNINIYIDVWIYKEYFNWKKVFFIIYVGKRCYVWINVFFIEYIDDKLKKFYSFIM